MRQQDEDRVGKEVDAMVQTRDEEGVRREVDPPPALLGRSQLQGNDLGKLRSPLERCPDHARLLLVLPHRDLVQQAREEGQQMRGGGNILCPSRSAALRDEVCTQVHRSVLEGLLGDL